MLHSPAILEKAKIAPEIKREDTTKYRALALANEVATWQADARKQIPDFDPWKDELYKQYPTKFRMRIRSMSEELKKCGADTAELDKTLGEADGPYQNITFLDAFFWNLRTAAYDIPGGATRMWDKALDHYGVSRKGHGALYAKNVWRGSRDE